MLIGIEDVIANALIELKTRSNINCISITQVEYYAENVIEKLKKHNVNAKFYTDRAKFDDFKNSYSKYFSVMETGTEVVCYAKEGITADNLKQKFRGCLSIDVLLAFIDDDVCLKSLPIPSTQEGKLIIKKRSRGKN